MPSRRGHVVRFLKGVLLDLWLILRGAVVWRTSPRQPASDIWTLTALTLIGGAGIVAAQYWVVRPAPIFDTWGIVSLLSQGFVLVAALALALGFVARSAALPTVLALALPSSLAGLAVRTMWMATRPETPGLQDQVIAGVLFLALPAVLLLRYVGRGASRPAVRGLAAFVLFVSMTSVADRHLPTWPVFASDSDPEEAASDYVPVDVEALYLAQDRLMADQIAALKPQDPSRPQAFGLLVGGTSYQSVFLSEVDRIGTLLSRDFGMDGHILKLANSKDEPTRLPMANRANLARALDALGQRMNPDKDIAFLYLTSHGGKDVFSLNFPQAGTTSLSAAELKSMLGAARLHNVVLVLSACHAGSFIDDLRAPDRLIIAAASAERTSFGCSDNVEWTWFGDAFANRALRETRDFRTAFHKAAATIRAWELVRLRLVGSNPEMDVGADIGGKIDAWLATLPDRAAPAAVAEGI